MVLHNSSLRPRMQRSCAVLVWALNEEAWQLARKKHGGYRGNRLLKMRTPTSWVYGVRRLRVLSEASVRALRCNDTATVLVTVC